MINFIKKHFNKIGYIALAIFFVVYNYHLHINMDLLLDSDMASEMMYAKLLVEEKTLISKRWYFSTGIETANIPMVFAPLFLLFDNWHTVRMLGVIILEILLFLSFYYVCKQLNIKHISWLAFLVLGCLSYDYFFYVIRGSYYIPFIALAFVSIGLVIDICKSEKKIIKSVLLILVSALSGLGGIRQVAQCYACLFGASILLVLFKQYKNIFNKKIDKSDTSFKLLIVSTISFVASLVGYLINKLILESSYTFNPAFSISIQLAPIQRLKDLAYYIFTLFGYETGNKITLVVAVVLILFTLYVCIKLFIDKKTNIYELWLLIMFICMYGVTLCIFLFTNMMAAARYFLLAQTSLVFIIGIYFKKDFSFTCLLIMPLVIVYSISNFNTCLNRYEYDEIVKVKNIDLIKAKNILLEEECYEGYGSFWYANIMTELSDGKIDAWCFCNETNGSDSVDVRTLYKWLQKKEHFERTPKGKTYLILPKEERESIIFTKDVTKNIKLETDTITLYIFNNSQEMFDSIGN